MCQITLAASCVHVSPADLSCDPVYRHLVRAALAGDAGALAACSDYRQERGLPALRGGLARRERDDQPVARAWRRWVRDSAGQAGTSYPIEIIAGDDAPELTGRQWHYVNASGDLIHHPSAYRKAWGKPIYVSSTLSIEVGRDWLIAHAPAL